MADEQRGVLPLRTEADIVTSRQAVRKLAASLKFTLVDQTKMITAASELARNALVHGGGGRMRWEIIEEGPKRALRLHFEDDGPGIPDVEMALRDGWSSGHGMGLGLPGSKRLVHEFAIRSTPGSGTCVTVTRWK